MLTYREIIAQAAAKERVKRNIQARVVNLGLLVHTSYMDGRWMAWDDRTYDGAPWQLGMGRSEDQAILELLSQIENQRYEEEDLP